MDRDPALSTDRLTSALVEFPRGRQLSFVCSTQLVPHQRVQIAGTKGRIEVQVPFNPKPDATTRVLVDDGTEFIELHGVEIVGKAEVVGEVPRTDRPDDVLAMPERLFGDKYAGGQFVIDGRHAWLRVVPDKVVSWDFRKLAW